MKKYLLHLAYLFFSFIFKVTDLMASKPTETKKVLIVKTDKIGDFILFSATLPYLKKKYPDYKFTLVARDIITELLPLIPEIDEFIPLTSQPFLKKVAVYSAVPFLIHNKFDVAIHAAYSRTAIGDYFVSLSNAPERITFEGDTVNQSAYIKEKTDKLYTSLIPSNPDQKKELDKYASLIGGLDIVLPSELLPHLSVTAGDLNTGERLLLAKNWKRRPFVVIQVFASVQEKMWSFENMEVIIDRLIERGYDILLTGSKEDLRVYDVSILRKPHVIFLIGETTIPTVTAILKKAEFYLGMDTATVHLSAAVGTPAICLIGGEHLDRFFPYGDRSKNHVVTSVTGKVKDILVESVWKEVEKMISKKPQ